MIAGPGTRKLLLTAHVASATGVLGAVAVFLAMAAAALPSRNEALSQGTALAMDIAADFVIVPLTGAALVTGIIQTLTTRWGLFRHYWVVVKLVLTVLVLVVLLLQTANIDMIAQNAAAAMSESERHMIRLSLALHAGGGLAILILIVSLSVYKPRGLTPYGWRKATSAKAS